MLIYGKITNSRKRVKRKIQQIIKSNVKKTYYDAVFPPTTEDLKKAYRKGHPRGGE
jgi:hypothetical protein